MRAAKWSLIVALGTTFFVEMNLLSIQDAIAQGNWGSVDYPKTYTNPDTGQQFCHYNSGVWTPCPGEGYTARQPNASERKCFGGTSFNAYSNGCPRAECVHDQASVAVARINFPGSGREISCDGLP